MTNKIRKTLIILGCCCVIAAAAFYMYNCWVSDRAAAAATGLTDTLSSLIDASETTATDEGMDPLLNKSEKDEATSTETEGRLVTQNVNGYNIIGIISIPAIDIKLAVISEWSYPNLKISACRYSGTPSGQLVLLAHNYKKHFGRLNELQSGDTVDFTDPNGTVYNYVVTGTEVKGKYELDDILSGDWDLTLFTCTYGGANRVVVRCKHASNPT